MDSIDEHSFILWNAIAVATQESSNNFGEGMQKFDELRAEFIDELRRCAQKRRYLNEQEE